MKKIFSLSIVGFLGAFLLSSNLAFAGCDLANDVTGALRGVFAVAVRTEKSASTNTANLDKAIASLNSIKSKLGTCSNKGAATIVSQKMDALISEINSYKKGTVPRQWGGADTTYIALKDYFSNDSSYKTLNIIGD